MDKKTLNAYTFPKNWFTKKKYGVTASLKNIQSAETFEYTQFSRSPRTFHSVILLFKDGSKKPLPFVFFDEDESYASNTALHINDFLNNTS